MSRDTVGGGTFTSPQTDGTLPAYCTLKYTRKWTGVIIDSLPTCGGANSQDGGWANIIKRLNFNLYVSYSTICTISPKKNKKFIS